MTFPREYKFTVPVGERFREAACRDRFFRLVTNRLKEQLARPLPVEETRLAFKRSFLTTEGYNSGRVELQTEQTPITVECVLSFRRFWLFLLAGCALVVASAVWPELISPIYAGTALAVCIALSVADFFASIDRFKRMIREQIARVDSDAALHESLAKASS
jgi:hypothetical protein